MAEFLHFSRDTKVYVEKDNRLWAVPVLDGFSFSQATNASEITLNEMEDATGRSRRGRRLFNDSLSAAEWSFSTYVRPFKAAGGTVYSADNGGRADATANKTHAVEEMLWVAMAGQNVYDKTTYGFKHGTDGGAISSIVLGGVTSANDAPDGVTTLAIDALNPSSGVTYSADGRNATIQVTVATGAVTAVLTERGTKFKTGETVTIAGSALGGTDDVTVTLTSESFTSDTTDLNINFYDSNRSSLGTFNLYFVLSNRSEGRLIYKLENAVVNEAGIDFEIDGISTINWTGNAGKIVDVTAEVTAQAAAPGSPSIGDLWVDTDDADALYVYDGSNFAHAIDEGTTDTGNFIRNRLTQLTLQPTAAFLGTVSAGTYENEYSIPITGGNITITNNVTYLTPEELGTVNQPIEHVTGTRSVTGSVTCYLGSSDASTNRSKDLFDDLVSDTTTVVNEFDMKFAIGGNTGTPRLEFNLGKAHIEIPTHSIADVISLETNFHGLGSSIGEADEVELTYVGA